MVYRSLDHMSGVNDQHLPYKKCLGCCPVSSGESCSGARPTHHTLQKVFRGKHGSRDEEPLAYWLSHHILQKINTYVCFLHACTPARRTPNMGRTRARYMRN